MSRFFKKLVDENLLSEWAVVLDWLFDDLKFSQERNWNRGYVGNYTKKLKELEYLSDKDGKTVYGKIDYKDYPNQIKNSRKKQTPYIMMPKGTGFARDLIRHIRNGIAHGGTSIYKVKDKLYISIIDYSDDSKKPEKQTAFLCFPLSYIVKFADIYNEVNKSIMNTKGKDRRATGKYKYKT